MPRRVINTKKQRSTAKRIGTKRYLPKQSSKKIFNWNVWFQQTRQAFAQSLPRKTTPKKRLVSKTIPRKPLAAKSTPRFEPSQPLIRHIVIQVIKIILSPLSILTIFAIKAVGLNRLASLVGTAGRVKVASYLMMALFSVIGVRLAFIQVPYFNTLSQDSIALAKDQQESPNVQIIPANRGNIFLSDLNRNDKLYQLTSNESRFKLVLYPSKLAEKLKSDQDRKLVNPFTEQEFVTRLSAATNISFDELSSKVRSALERKLIYFALSKEINSDQRDAVIRLLAPPKNPITKKSIHTPFNNFIAFETVTSRTYPERTTLGSTIGFTSSSYSPADTAKMSECRAMITANQAQGTEDRNGYTVGQYGLERAFCTELAGVNGKITSAKTGPNETSEIKPVDGIDIVLTIDKNLQTKAEQVLKQAVDDNANGNGKPISGNIIVMQAKSGRILAQANYPNLDPNNVTSSDYESGAVKNQASIAYEPGSVIKPLTVSTARDVYEQGKVKADGTRLGVPDNYAEIDSDQNGFVFPETNGKEKRIYNANNRSFKELGPMSLSDILRNSINTLIARLQKERLNTETTREYLLNKFKLGDSTVSDLFTTEPPNTNNFESDINSPFSYANMAFGQGFSTTPLNIVRSYSTIANNGTMVEPRIVERVTRGGVALAVTYPEPQKVIEPKVAREVKTMMQNVVERGFGAGTKASLAKMDNYTAGGKTGTAQIARPLITKNAKGEVVKVPCTYACNSDRGLYDHTFVGFAPVNDPQIIVLVKLSQPKPGDTNNNYAEFSTAPAWKLITEYSLNYLGVPKDR